MISTQRIRFTVVLLLSFAGVAHSDLVIERQRWGFDDHLIGGGIIPFSALIYNDGDKDFRGQLTFYRTELSQRVGINEISEPVVIEPGGRRWVQFTPRMPFNIEYQQYEIGAGIFSTIEVETPQSDRGDPAQSGVVRLAGDSEPFHVDPSISSFPEHLMPEGAPALSSLRELIIDHSPELSRAQQQSIRDWVWLGGKLHLLLNEQSRYPELPGVLADLSPGHRDAGAASRVAFGWGEIVLQPFGRRDLTRDKLGVPLPRVKSNQILSDSRVYENMVQLTLVPHSWGLIYAAVFLLIVALGPANWWIARRVRRYGYGLLATVLIVGAFSFLFYWVGKAGQNRVRGLYTFSYARALDRGYALESWSHLFVTRGGEYRIRPKGEANYSYAGRLGPSRKIDGRSRNGPQGSLSLRVPLYASRQFTSASTWRTGSIVLEADVPNERFWFTDPGENESELGLEAAWIQNGRLRWLKRGADGAWTPSGVAWKPSESWRRDQQNRHSAVGHLSHRNRGEPLSPAGVCRPLAYQCMEELQKRLAGSNHDGHDQLLIFARADAIFPIESTVAEAAHYVLFHHLLTENENR